MFRNALVYRITQWEAPALAALQERVAAAPFVEGAASQPLSAGWVAPRGERHGALVESVGGQWILQWCSETRAVPAAAVRQRLEAELQRLEDESGRRPRGRRVRELKEAIVHELLPRAFPRRSVTPVWVDARAGLVVVGVASVKKADAIVTALVEALGAGATLRPLQTASAPAAAMSDWLAQQAAPAGFSVDRDCELKQPDAAQAAVRYARHPLEIDEIAAHIAQGKRPTRLALTWNDRVSFVLTDAMALRSLKWLDVGTGDGQDAGGDDGFDADVAITTGEMAPMIAALVEALGGEAAAGAAAGDPQGAAREAANDEAMQARA